MRRIIGVGCTLAVMMMLVGGHVASAAPAKPTITSPTAGAQICPMPGKDADVTGSGTADLPTDLLVDGAVASSTTSSATGSYSLPLDQEPGTYQLTVQQTDDSGTTASDPVQVTVIGPADVLGTVASSPATISPKTEDGHFDTSTLSVLVKKAGAVVFSLYRGSTNVTDSPKQTAEASSTASWAWNGRGSTTYNHGATVNSGRYSVRAIWSDTSCTLTRVGEIAVDNVAPTISSYDVAPFTFYPRTDDALAQFRNDITFFWTGLTEKAYITVHVRNAASGATRTIVFGYSSGHDSVSWDGRYADGTLYPAGTYEWQVFMTDAVHNVRSTLTRHFALSSKHLVRRTMTTKVDGKDTHSHFTSGCGRLDNKLSDFPAGLWISVPNCHDDGVEFDGAEVSYALSVPPANYYGPLAFKVDGFSRDGDLLVGFLRDYATGGDDFFGSVHETSPSPATLGTTTASGRYVSSGRHVLGSLILTSQCDCADVEYDVRAVYVDLTYAVLGD